MKKAKTKKKSRYGGGIGIALELSKKPVFKFTLMQANKRLADELLFSAAMLRCHHAELVKNVEGIGELMKAMEVTHTMVDRRKLRRPPSIVTQMFNALILAKLALAGSQAASNTAGRPEVLNDIDRALKAAQDAGL